MNQMDLGIKESKPIAKDKRDVADKTIRLAVSGDVVLTTLEVAIVDSAEFQRLRWLKQLGTSYLVYPSAVHTRFEHSLGVLKVTDQIINNIVHNKRSDKNHDQHEVTKTQNTIARIAALLHDIANIPFGHTLEDETKVVQTYQEDKDRFDRFLTSTSEVGLLLRTNLSSGELDLLTRVLIAKKDPKDREERKPDTLYVSDLGKDAFIVDIIKNTVCADLIDYLARDSFFCGLPLSIPDRFLSYLFIHESENHVKRLAIRIMDSAKNLKQALISELIQLLETRYFLAERVYFHHAKQITSAMIGAATYDAINNYQKYRENNEDAAFARFSVDSMMQMSDREFIDKLKEYPGGSAASKIARDLDRRILYKTIYTFDKGKSSNGAKQNDTHIDALRQQYHLDPDERNRVELVMCETVDFDPGDIIIYCPDPDMNLKIAEMKVTNPEGGIIDFCELNNSLAQVKVSSILESHKQLWNLKVCIKKARYDDLQKDDEDIIVEICKFLFEVHHNDNAVNDMRNHYRRVINYLSSKEGRTLGKKESDLLLEYFMDDRKDFSNKQFSYKEKYLHFFQQEPN